MGAGGCGVAMVARGAPSRDGGPDHSYTASRADSPAGQAPSTKCCPPRAGPHGGLTGQWRPVTCGRRRWFLLVAWPMGADHGRRVNTISGLRLLHRQAPSPSSPPLSGTTTRVELWATLYGMWNWSPWPTGQQDGSTYSSHPQCTVLIVLELLLVFLYIKTSHCECMLFFACLSL